MGSDGYPDLERRKFSRLKDNIFILGSLKSSPTEEFKAITNNISADGIMFETERNISKDSELELEIYQPVNRHKDIIFSIPVLARVIWVEELKKDNFEQGENIYRIGIEFSEIKEEDRQRVAKFINESI
jgi:c-di-GMP-binding flagellar brake protein YcgR